MDVEIIKPDWIEKGTVTVRLTELNPHAAAALIETLRDALSDDDHRVRLLVDLWDTMTDD